MSDADLVKYGPQLVSTGFGRRNGTPELIKIADSICERAVILMLKLESGNLHEIRLNRVIAYGHTYVLVVSKRKLSNAECLNLAGLQPLN